MRFSAWPGPNRSWHDIVATARAVDDAGWYGVWFADHFMPNTPDGAVADGDTHECWAVLPAIAALTTSVRIGPLVTPTSVHHPAVLANRAATIDHISDGRFVLGLGAGWQVNEHAAYGIELPPPGKRVSRFEEAIQIIGSLLTQPRTSFTGEYYTVTDAPCDPKPVQTPLPMLVGTASPRMLRITVRHADEWNTWGNPDLAAERRGLFLAACDEVGRDPATMRTSVQAMLFTSDDPERLEQLRGRVPDATRAVVGTTAEIVDAVGRYAELGFDEFIVPDFSLGRELSQRLDAYAHFHEHVAAAFPA